MLVISLASITYYTFTTYYPGNVEMLTSHLIANTTAGVEQGRLAGLVIRDIRQTGSAIDPVRNAEKRVRDMAQMEFEHRLGQYYLSYNASLRNTRARQSEARKLYPSASAIADATPTSAMH